MSLTHSLQQQKSKSQPRLNAKRISRQATVKFAAKRTFSAQNNVIPSLGQKMSLST